MNGLESQSRHPMKTLDTQLILSDEQKAQWKETDWDTKGVGFPAEVHRFMVSAFKIYLVKGSWVQAIGILH